MNELDTFKEKLGTIYFVISVWVGWVVTGLAIAAFIGWCLFSIGHTTWTLLLRRFF